MNVIVWKDPNNLARHGCVEWNLLYGTERSSGLGPLTFFGRVTHPLTWAWIHGRGYIINYG